MSVGKMSVRAKTLCVVVILTVLGAGIYVWLAQSDDGKANALEAPVKPCWNGTPNQATLQKLLGPGSELQHQQDDFRVIAEHYPTHCQYEAESEGSLDTVLDVDVAWNDDAPPTEELPTADARGDEPRTRMDMGVLAYYLRASQVVFFECIADLPDDTPAYMKRDKYIKVDVLARPMKGSGLSAVEARKVGVDIMLQLARDVANQAGCKNNTSLPSAVPSISKANWPGYEE
ncbi:hypothetical protein OG252_15800 [Streptomyces sp. NBC_01352]|uniref:hypothetical protein n=1 Tax=Streptomyces sp. NBC_01352 TaxID=2903834 RepID=UPI002E34CA6B|nr:hypothetical protein [Streptomyces sp. NBC_01352]